MFHGKWRKANEYGGHLIFLHSPHPGLPLLLWEGLLESGCSVKDRHITAQVLSLLATGFDTEIYINRVEEIQPWQCLEEHSSCLGWVSSTHEVAHNHLIPVLEGSTTTFSPLSHADKTHPYAYTKNKKILKNFITMPKPGRVCIYCLQTMPQS